MRTSNVRLIAGDGNFSRWIEEDDARSKLQSGCWEEVYDHASGRFKGIRKIEFQPRPSDTESATSITMRDSLANVGIWDGKAESEGGEIPVGMIAAAQAKVFFYPLEGDNKAVRVSCLARA